MKEGISLCHRHSVASKWREKRLCRFGMISFGDFDTTLGIVMLNALPFIQTYLPRRSVNIEA
jgi:hypothetical protein